MLHDIVMHKCHFFKRGRSNLRTGAFFREGGKLFNAACEIHSLLSVEASSAPAHDFFHFPPVNQAQHLGESVEPFDCLLRRGVEQSLEGCVVFRILHYEKGADV